MDLTKQESGINLVSFLTLTKKEIESLATTNVNLWEEEGEDILSIQSLFVKLELYSSEVKEQLAKKLIEEVARDKKKSINGVVFSLSNTSKYDYSNSPAWIEIKKQIEPLMEKLKAIEAIAKATKTRSEWTDDDGACYLVYPPVNTASETTKATIK